MDPDPGRQRSLIDIHCHLDFDQFRKDLDQAIDRARKAGVKIIVQNGVNPESNRKSIRIAEDYPDIVRLALGMYPIDALKLSEKEFDAELKFIEQNKENIIALGEVGIDHHWSKDKAEWKKQENNFQKIIALAERTGKPLIVHSREAEKETFEALQSSNAKKVVMHCFNGGFETIKKAESLGYYFTIPTNIVKSKHFKKMAKRLPLERLFTETDAPFMSPFPGKRNEPAFVKESADKIAEVRGISLEEAEEQMMKNFNTLFGE